MEKQENLSALERELAEILDLVSGITNPEHWIEKKLLEIRNLFEPRSEVSRDEQIAFEMDERIKKIYSLLALIRKRARGIKKQFEVEGSRLFTRVEIEEMLKEQEELVKNHLITQVCRRAREKKINLSGWDLAFREGFLVALAKRKIIIDDDIVLGAH